MEQLSRCIEHAYTLSGFVGVKLCSHRVLRKPLTCYSSTNTLLQKAAKYPRTQAAPVPTNSVYSKDLSRHRHVDVSTSCSDLCLNVVPTSENKYADRGNDLARFRLGVTMSQVAQVCYALVAGLSKQHKADEEQEGFAKSGEVIQHNNPEVHHSLELLKG